MQICTTTLNYLSANAAVDESSKSFSDFADKYSKFVVLICINFLLLLKVIHVNIMIQVCTIIYFFDK